MINGNRIAGLLGLSLAGAFATAQTPKAPITLKVGDLAPSLSAATWLKGSAPGPFGDGKVHVVEFWATWCGPCRMSMPHLSQLAQDNKDVSVASISIWETAEMQNKSLDYTGKVEALVDNAHDMMNYTVGMDDKAGHIGNAWMTAAGQQGIPTAFVIDQDGKIAWIGVPFTGLDKIVPLVAHHQLTADLAAKIKADYKANLAQFLILEKQAEDDLKKNDLNGALKACDDSIGLMPVFDDYVIPVKYEALNRIDREKGRAYAHEIIRTHSNAPVLLITMMGRRILADTSKDADYATALELIRAGMKCVDFDEGFEGDLLAEAYAKTGNYAMAVETEQKVIKSMDDPVREAQPKQKTDAEAKLKSYQTNLQQKL
jgi:thiol-disulfide isomerase/thioredoxin